jgi:hypothetical protein
MQSVKTYTDFLHKTSVYQLSLVLDKYQIQSLFNNFSMYINSMLNLKEGETSVVLLEVHCIS